ncbi:ATP-binding protein [Kocuria sp. M1R5S2]|uniref:ATP-binding protein n=1 Tax=Kocuria rhizosphaerae TaxID=3376285 RepID=UPI0037A22C3F
MPEPQLRRFRRGPATAGTVDALHADLDALWEEAPWVAEADRMAFTLAVVETAGNVVRHAVPAAGDAVELAVDLAVAPRRLRARIREIGAAPASVELGAPMVQEDLESGRGLAMVRALVGGVGLERDGDSNVWTLSRECGR